MKINIIDEFGTKTCHGTKRMQVSSQPIRFKNLVDMFLIHYFKIKTFSKIYILQTIRCFCRKFISFQYRECLNDLLNTKFEEPTSNTDISGKTKNDKTL